MRNAYFSSALSDTSIRRPAVPSGCVSVSTRRYPKEIEKRLMPVRPQIEADFKREPGFAVQRAGNQHGVLGGKDPPYSSET